MKHGELSELAHGSMSAFRLMEQLEDCPGCGHMNQEHDEDDVPDLRSGLRGRAEMRPLFPFDLGPEVELSDGEHVLVWIGCAVLVAAGLVLWNT